MPIDIATGNVELARDDFSLPGRVPIKWTRLYRSTLLSDQGSLLGPGWTTPWFAKLRPLEQAWEFSHEGVSNSFPDPDARIENGQLIRLLGAFLELIREDDAYVVTSWDVESGDIRRFVFRKDGNGPDLRLVAVENVSGEGVDLSWDAAGRLSQLRQRTEKRTVLLNYHSENLISSLDLLMREGGQTQMVRYEYDGAGRFAAAFDRRDLANRYEYDGHSRLSREVLKDGAVYSYRYDNRNRCVHFTGLDHYNEKRLRFLDSANRTMVTNSYGKTTVYEYLPSGQIASETDPLGNERRTEFDEWGRIAAKIDPLGGTTTYTYDENGNRNSILDALQNEFALSFNAYHQPLSLTNPLRQTWRREHDEKQRLSATTNPLGNRWTIAYNEDGNSLVITNPLGSRRYFRFRDGLLQQRTDWVGNTTYFQWDGSGRLIERIGPMGERTVFDYDAVGNSIGAELPGGVRLQATYDQGGNLSSFTDAAGQLSKFRFGSCGRLIECTDPIGRSVRYNWGTEPKRLEEVVNERNERLSYFRDESGRIVRERLFDGREQSYSYDAVGRCVAFTDGKGETNRFTRRLDGRLEKQVAHDQTITRFGYNPVGQVVKAVNPDAVIAFQYDSAGRLILESQGEEWVRTDYDPAGDVIQVRTSLGHEISYTLDPNGRVRELCADNRFTLSFQHDARGLEVERSMPGGLQLEQEFDLIGNMLQQRVNHSQSSGLSIDADTRTPTDSYQEVKRQYSWGVAGLLASASDNRWGPTDYTYDPAGRLISVFCGMGPDEHFDYDATDNITRMQRGGSGRIDHQFEYSPGNLLVRAGDTQYTYDANGCLVRKTEFSGGDQQQVWNYSWDGRGQLRKVQRPDGFEAEYKYDAFGRRIAKLGPHGTRQFLWNGDSVIHEKQDGVEPTTWIMKRRSFAPLAKLQGRSFFSIVNDHLGTPREMFDNSGKVVWAVRLTAWGRTEADYSSSREHDCPIRFQGQWLDEETGLHYNRFRYYDPLIARFISVDPIGIAGGRNFFQYVRNPTAWIDPFGLADTCPEVRETDLSGGPHAPDRSLNQIMSRAARTGNPQGQWTSNEATMQAAELYDPAKGGVQVVPIAEGDGIVVHHPVTSYPAQPGETPSTHDGLPVSVGGPLVVPADKAVVIPSSDGLHTFPIDDTHPQYNQ